MLKYNRKNLYQLLFLICVAVPVLNIYELTFGVWLIAALLTMHTRYSVRIVKYVSCFVAILLIALISSFFNDKPSYNFVRDVAYLCKPILGLLIGYQICKRIGDSVYTTIIFSGLAIAVVHLCIVFSIFLKFHTIAVDLLRMYGGYFSDFEIYVLIILFFHKKFNLALSPKQIWIFGTIVFVSSFLYLSRTNFIQFFILFFAMKGYFAINNRSMVLLSSGLLLVGSAYAAVYYSNPQRAGKGIEAFLYKIKNAPIEPFKTKVNTDDWKDFNDNYRSYENILTVKQVSNEGPAAVVMGKGMGATVNLGREIYTTDGTFVQYLPILHNGFATVFLKSGLLGVFFLVITILLLFNRHKSQNQEINNINLLLVGTGVFMIVSYWVFMGLYLKLDNKSILIGLLFCYRELLAKDARLNELS